LSIKRNDKRISAFLIIVALLIIFNTETAWSRVTSLPDELITNIAADIESFFDNHVPAPNSGKISIGIAMPVDTTGKFDWARYRLRSDIQQKIILMENLRLLPSSRFDVLMATMFPGQTPDSLSDDQFKEFAGEAPVNYLVMGKFVIDDNGEVKLLIELRNAYEGRMLFSPEYVIEKGRDKSEVTKVSESDPEAYTKGALSGVAEEIENIEAGENDSEIVDSNNEVEEEPKVVEQEEKVIESDIANIPETPEMSQVEQVVDEKEKKEVETETEDKYVTLESKAQVTFRDAVSDVESEGSVEEDTENVKYDMPEKGGVKYFKDGLSNSQVLDIYNIELDDKGAHGLIVLTSGSMEVLKLNPDYTTEVLWSGKFKTQYPVRGLSGRLSVGIHNDIKLIFVSMTPFDKSFAYEWKQGKMEKAGRVSGFVIDVFDNQMVHLVSDYGKGVVTFSGENTRIIDTSGDETRIIEFRIPEEYYSGCISEWSDISAELVEVSVVTEEGRLKYFKGSENQKYVSDEIYGNQLECADNNGEMYYFTTTNSKTDDTVVMIERNGDIVKEVWRGQELGGTVLSITGVDFDSDGNIEIIGVLEKQGGAGTALFHIVPEYQ